MRWVRWILIAQVLVFAGWIGREEWKRVAAPAIVLETAPVDPRDLWAGQYLQLRYAITWIGAAQGFPAAPPAGSTPVAVFLRPELVRHNGVPTTVWRAAGCRVPAGAIPARQDPAQGVWVLGTWTGLRTGVTYGVERYYFSEARKKEFAARRSGALLIECAVGRDGGLAIRKLIE